jgi:predicted Zn finger-like uncharacterized protein
MAIIRCPNCHTKYRISEKKLEHSGRIRCKRCQRVFRSPRAGKKAFTEKHTISTLQEELGESQNSGEQFQPGSIIQNRYQVEAVLGQGGMGTTYKAFDVTTQQTVAVKLLHFSRIQEWKALEMFEREARLLQQLNHPRIPAYVDYLSIETSSDIQFLLVQEYIAGKTLQQLVEEGWQGSEVEILDIFLQLAEILEYLHNLRPPVIHRDINPKNIIFSPANEVYLVDFGAVQEKIHTTFLGGSTIVGTSGYVPFEQFSGQTVPASDYYALGATLLYMLTHRHPADFDTENLKPLFHPFLQASPNVILLLEGLLEPDIKQRVASLEQIQAILAGQSTSSSVHPSELTKPPGPVKSPEVVALPAYSTIKKIIEENQHICFQITTKDRVAELILVGGGSGLSLTPLIFMLSVLLTKNLGIPLSIGSLMLLFWTIFIILPVGGIALLKKNKHITIDITPEQIRIKRTYLGIQFRKTQQIPTDALQPSDINWYFKNIETFQKKPIYQAVMGINYQNKTSEITGKTLTKTEVEWLAQEIKTYLSNL